jgi:hypothetical protein
METQKIKIHEFEINLVQQQISFTGNKICASVFLLQIRSPKDNILVSPVKENIQNNKDRIVKLSPIQSAWKFPTGFIADFF